MPQRVPSAYVQPTVTSSPEERLRSLTQQILSRTRLEEIVREFDLYREERATGIMEDVITRMRENDITLSVPERGRDEGGASSFTISYVGNDADTVKRVTERITSLVIEENLKDRERLAEGTDEFLETQMQSARTRLIEQEKRLEEYRRRHAGELPSQVQSNLQVLQNSQLQLQSLQQALAQDRDRKFMHRSATLRCRPDGSRRHITQLPGRSGWRGRRAQRRAAAGRRAGKPGRGRKPAHARASRRAQTAKHGCAA